MLLLMCIFMAKLMTKKFTLTILSIYTLLLENNIPVFVGEIGLKRAVNDRLDMFKVLLEYMQELNLKVALLDNGHDRKFVDRKTGKIENVKFVKFAKTLFDQLQL